MTAAAEPAALSAPTPTPAPTAPVAPVARASTAPAIDHDQWPDLVASLALRGPVRELAASSAFLGHEGDVLRLSLPASDEHLRAPFLVQQLADALGARWGSAPQIRFEAGAVTAAGETLHARNERVRDERQGVAESTFLNDPDVQRLMGQHGARLVPDSIRPLEDQEH